MQLEDISHLKREFRGLESLRAHHGRVAKTEKRQPAKLFIGGSIPPPTSKLRTSTNDGNTFGRGFDSRRLHHYMRGRPGFDGYVETDARAGTLWPTATGHGKLNADSFELPMAA